MSRTSRGRGRHGGDDGQEPPITPRSAYSRQKRRAEALTMDLMMNLDAHTIASIKKEFVENGGEVDIYEFVRIMRTYLPDRAVKPDASAASETKADTQISRSMPRIRSGISLSHRRTSEPPTAPPVDERRPSRDLAAEMQLVANLCELFKEIDVNGDAMMEWDEFTSFIVDKAVVFRDDASVDAIAGYSPVHIAPVVEERSKRAVMGQPRKARGAPGKRRAPQFHDEVVENLRYIPRLNQLALLEQRNPVIKMVDASTFALKGELRGHDGIPEAVEYIETPSSYLISSCADSTMALWDLDPGSKQYSYITCWPTPHVQMSLAWSRQYTTLYSGSTTGLVHSWDIKSREETSCMAGHSDIVMDVVAIQQLDNVASASLDSTICMWDMCTGSLRQTLKGHKKGVLSLAYCPDFRFVISSGFDHEALVWSPFVPSLLYKLKGHSTPLLGVRSVPNKPEVITASVDGQYKVWDLRSFKCVQTFSDENAVTQNVGAFEHCPSIRRIVSATKKLSAFDQGGDKQLTKVSDDVPITCALFNSTSMTILTASGRTVKIWNALTGTLLRVYRDVTESDITSVCLDDRQRKFIAGETNGSVRVYNYANGAVMKSMVSHTREVSKLLYCNELKVVISCSWDRSIVVHDEMDPEKGVVLRMMDHLRAHDADVSCADWNHAVSVVATGSSDKTVRVWDLETGKLEALLPHPAEVVAVKFLAPLPLLLSADASGNVFLWGVRTSNCKHILAAAWSLNPTGFWPSRLAARAAAKAELEAKAEAAVKTRVGGGGGGGKDAEGDGLSEEEKDSIEVGPTAAPSRGSFYAADLEQQRHTFEASYVASVSWDFDSRTVYTGDERGQLSAWDVSELLRVIDDDECKPGNVHCRPDADSRSADSTMAALYDGPELVTMEWVSRAHKDTITSVEVVADPPSLISSSYDKCVYAWTRDGSSIGLLCRSVRGGRNPFWNLPVDVAKRARAEDESTAHTLEVLSQRARERRGAQDLSDKRARAAAHARARERASGAAPMKVGTGFWAAEAEASRHRTRQRKDREALQADDGMAGGSSASHAHLLAARSMASMGTAASGGRGGRPSGRTRGKPTPLHPKLLAKVAPRASPLEATRKQWAGTEMATRETQARVANALNSMASNMVGRMSRAAGAASSGERHGQLTRVPKVADSEILQSLSDSTRKYGGGMGVGSAGGGPGSHRSQRGRRQGGSSELRNAGAASILSNPSSAPSTARSVSMFNSKTIEAAARLGAILSDLG